MKKALRILAWILALLVLLLLAGLVAVQSPRVQTALGNKLIGKVQEKMDADIRFRMLTLRPFDALVLDDVVIVDREPRLEGMDTLAYVGSLSAKFSPWGLLRGQGAYLSHARMEDVLFQLAIEPDSLSAKGTRTNLQRIFRLPEKDPDKPDKGWGDLLSAREIVVKNAHFRLVNPKGAAKMAAKGRVPGPNTIDWNNLDATLLYARAHHLRVADSKITGQVDSLTLQENHSGFRVEQASARHVRVGARRVRIDRLELRERYSHLHLNRLRLDGDISDYDEFIDRIRMEVDVKEGTEVSMKTVSFFGPKMDRLSFRGRLKGKADGYVSDLALRDITVEDLDHDVRVQATGRLMGVTDIQTALLDMQAKELRFTLDGLAGFVKAWAPQTRLDLHKLAPGQRFTFSGTAKGPLNRLQVNGKLLSDLGALLANVNLRNTVDSQRPILIGGTAQTLNLDLGTLTGIKALGPVSLQTKLDAALKKSGPEVQIESLQIDRLNALGYDYTNISAAGNYTGDAFDGRIIAADPNLSFLFQGLFNLSKRTKNAAWRFYASLGYADLHALHLDKRPQSKLSFQASSNFLRTEARDLLGDVTISGLSLESATGRHDLGDISVKAHANDNVHRIRIKSDFLSGSYLGEKPVTDFVNDLRHLILDRELGALSEQHARPWDGTPYEVNLQVREAHDLLDFLAPGAYVANPTDLSLKVGKDGVVHAQLQSGRLAYKNKFIKDLDLTLDNAGQVLRAQLAGSNLQFSPSMQLRNNRLSVFADNNHLGMGYAFDNSEEAENTRAELYLSMDLERDQEGLSINGRALPSNIYYKGAGWGLASGDITYKGGDLHVDRLMARHEDEILLVDGGYSPTRTDTLSVRMERFDIGLLNTITGNKPPVAGHASGQALVISPKKPSLGLVAGIRCDSTFVSGQALGRLELASNWDEPNQRFQLNVSNNLNGYTNLDLDAYLLPKNQTLHGRLQLDKFNLGCAAPFLESVFSIFAGHLTGTVDVDGPLKNLALSSPGLKIENGLMALDFTRALYHLDGNLGLDKDALRFNGVNLNDGQGGTGQVNGALYLGGFKNLALDTHVRFNQLQALNLPRGANPTLYGVVYATGNVDITGPLNRLLVDVNATTAKAGDLHLPIGSSSGERDRNMLVFAQPEDPLEQIDPYDLLVATHEKIEKGGNNLTVRLTARATPDVTAYIDIGEENSLNAKGSGTISMEMQSAAHSFSLGGDYTLQEGSFHFSAMNLVSRDFSIQNGSSVRFNGGVMDTDLNVKGLYVTKASLANLITSVDAEGNSSTGNRRTVNCGIDITGKLRNPEISFSIDVPDLSPSAQLEVQTALNTEDKVQKQFLYLLIASSFLPSEESGITTDGSEMLFSNVSSIMSGQINNIFEKLDIPLDLGLNYQATQEGKNLFDVAVSTQLFNNRVIVNGTVGNKQRLGTTTNEIAGDLDIEIKMSRNGALRLTLFSHSADQFSSYLDNSQRNGAGITYQREFNTFSQFFRELFSTKKQREEWAARLRQSGGVPQTVLQIDSLGRAHVIENGKR